MTVKGRFVEGTKSGVKLMYGFPDAPWSSYTTVKIDAPGTTVTIFGGDGGTWITDPADGLDASNEPVNTCTWKMSGINITQGFTIVKNPRTGNNPDTVQIKYTVENTNTFTARVGLRVMLDTQLAENDNSPVIASGYGRITQDMTWSGADVPEAWYTLDDYFNPSIKAEGDLKLASATAPDIFMIGDWSYMKEDANLWTYAPNAQDIQDAAVAVFWNAQDYKAGESKSFITYYGLQDASGAELGITKSVDTAASAYGDILSYNINYSDITTIPLTGLAIWDSLPWNTTFIDASGSYSTSGNTIIWNSLPGISGNTSSYSQWVRVRINSFEGISVTNSASAVYTDTYWNDKKVKNSNTTSSSIATLTPSVSPTISPTSTITPTGTPQPPDLTITLKGSFPNPAHEAANFIFNISRAASVKLLVYTVSGELIVIRSASFQGGNNAFLWDLKNSQGKKVASGTYVYILEATTEDDGKKTVKGKMSVVR
jgi:uncharacterized repeat protein (TIGR01451 family)